MKTTAGLAPGCILLAVFATPASASIKGAFLAPENSSMGDCDDTPSDTLELELP